MLCTTVTEQCQNECILRSLMFTWLRSGFPVISASRLIMNIKAYIMNIKAYKYMNLKKSQHKTSQGLVASRKEFIASLRGKCNFHKLTQIMTNNCLDLNILF